MLLYLSHELCFCAGFLSRVLPGSISASASGNSSSSNALSALSSPSSSPSPSLLSSSPQGMVISSPDPSSVQHHPLPAEWQTLFRNAAAKSLTKGQSQQLQQQ